MFCFRRPLFGSLPLVAAAALACGGESLTIPPTTGTLQVTTSTSGAEADPDGYVVQVDGGPEQSIGASGSIQNEEVEPGTHLVQLAGLAPNCTVGGDNPRTVSITAGETETVAFEVTCGATTGGLQVSSSTDGPSPDADGYSVTVDGIDRGVVPATGSLAVDALSPGDHLVGLSGVAGNCQVQGDNPRTVAVTNGAIATVAFTITCTTPPANVGSIRIATATTGADQDANGYAFALDGGPTQPIGVSTSTILSQIGVGPHSVNLSGVAANCTVQGTNPRAVTVAAGATADVSFAIGCSGTTGTIRVNVTTSGSPTDPDGYTVRLDGAAPGRAIGTNQSLDFPGVAAGNHSVALSGLVSNCSVTGGPSKNVNVTVGATAEVSFAVTCAATTGSIRVTTATTGSNPDDAYSVSVDGGTAQNIGANGAFTFNGIAAGTHSVELSGVAGNCEVDGNNPRSANVTAGSTAEVAFAVACTAPATGPGSWTVRASIPTPRQGLAGAVVQNGSGEYILYAIGGTDGTPESPALQQVEAYNAKTNAWTPRAPLPSARVWISATAIDGNIYVPGGADASGAATKSLYVYSPGTNTWAEKKEMPVAGFFNIADVVGGKLYVLTSCDLCDSQRLYRYDPVTDEWTRLSDPINEHADGVMAAIDGKLYAAWGSTAKVDMYDPATGNWTNKLTMAEGDPVEVSRFGSAGLNFNKKLYVIGGRIDDEAQKRTLAYDPVTNAWVDKTEMNFAREHSAVGKVKDAAGVLQILVAGGLGTDPNVKNVKESEAFTP